MKFDMLKVDYEELRETNLNWIFQEKKNLIISPDTDGMLCGLISSYLFGDKIVGTYDDVCLTLKDGFDFYASDLSCYDCEILMPNIKSIGNHYIPKYVKSCTNCADNVFNIGMYRDISKYPQKYPFGVCHFLYMLLYYNGYDLPKLTLKNGVPFLHADGFHTNFSNYYENASEWFEYLKGYDEDSPFIDVRNGSVEESDKILNDFRRNRDELKWKTSRDGDDISIFNKSKSVFFDDYRYKVDDNLLFSFIDKYIEKKKLYINLLAKTIGIPFIEENFDIFEGFRTTVYEKVKVDKLSEKNIKDVFLRNKVISCCQTDNTTIAITIDNKIKNNQQLSLF